MWPPIVQPNTRAKQVAGSPVSIVGLTASAFRLGLTRFRFGFSADIVLVLVSEAECSDSDSASVVCANSTGFLPQHALR